MSELAIVIPAYKGDFLAKTLESLALQTCKDFHVYIGDDCSPYNLYDIVKPYSERITLSYERFDSNLGGKDLVGQWKRCIEMSREEDWICLFSDDDMMESKCVEMFYKEVAKDEQYDIYHFNVDIIDSNDNRLTCSRSFPSTISSEAFYKGKASGHLDSFVVEYFFSRKIYSEVGGFQFFDLAWGSDIATWVKMGHRKGIKTISGAKVLWRCSDKNITPKLDQEIVFRKFGIEVDFLSWINSFFNTKGMHWFNRYAFFRSLFHYSNILNRANATRVSKKSLSLNVISYIDYFFFTKGYGIIRLIKKYFR